MSKNKFEIKCPSCHGYGGEMETVKSKQDKDLEDQKGSEYWLCGCGQYHHISEVYCPNISCIKAISKTDKSV